MIYKRQRSSRRWKTGQYRLINEAHQQLAGYGEGDWVRLRDERGRIWWGRVQMAADETMRFIFWDNDGHLATGLADEHGIVLRDSQGRTWRGTIE